MLPPEVHGVVRADGWRAYSHLQPARGQLCWAHLARDLRGIVDASPDDVETDLILRRVHQLVRSCRVFKDSKLARVELKAAVTGSRGCLHRWTAKAAQADEKSTPSGMARYLIKMWPADLG